MDTIVVYEITVYDESGKGRMMQYYSHEYEEMSGHVYNLRKLGHTCKVREIRHMRLD